MEIRPFKARWWALTLNNPKIREIEQIAAIMQQQRYADFYESQAYDNQYEFFIAGKEHYNIPGKTPHFQMCFKSAQPMSFRLVKDIFPRAHIEIARCPQSAYQYCKKGGDYRELEPFPILADFKPDTY